MAMAGDLRRLGQRITELRAGTPVAVVARRAGIAPAYLHALEKATPNKSTGEPSVPSVPVLRSIAFALPDASASELLELAGYEEDIIAYDRMREQRSRRVQTEAITEPPALTPDEAVAEIRHLLERLEGSEDRLGGEGGPGAEQLRLVAPDRRRTGNRDKKGTA